MVRERFKSTPSLRAVLLADGHLDYDQGAGPDPERGLSEHPGAVLKDVHG